MTWTYFTPGRSHRHLITIHGKFDGEFEGPDVDIREDRTDDGMPAICLLFLDPSKQRESKPAEVEIDPELAEWLGHALVRAAAVARSHHGLRKRKSETETQT